jgi:hypothetical protein
MTGGGRGVLGMGARPSNTPSSQRDRMGREKSFQQGSPGAARRTGIWARRLG